MPGLDRKIIAQIDHESVIAHVKADIRSDFILAPHYNAIFNRADDELWEQLKQQLRAGTYQPELPITMSVPKERFFTRPGSILRPLDRLMYQALIDNVMEQLEEGHDRSRSFSHVPSHEAGKMFEPNHESWESFQERIAEICGESEFILKADISNYFERLPQHNLINLMSAAGCAPEAVSLLEEMLLAFRERNSFGIVQGVYPSDALGNFYLSALDAHCELDQVLSARYVDDIYMGFQSEAEARKGLADLIETLRKDGLHLNEHKSKIMPADDVMREETAIDRLFDEVRDELADDEIYHRASPYGFEVEWEDEDDEADEEEEDDNGDEDLQNAAVERLIGNIGDYPNQEDQIEKFCLPILRSAQSDTAIEHVLGKLKEKPHQTRLYFSYISTFVRTNGDVVDALEALVADDTVSNYQRMFLLAALIRAKTVSRATVNTALQWLQNRTVAKETRAIAAIFAAKHGVAQQKRTVRTSYEDEPSDYVRSAILYSSRYLTAVEKKTCKRAWGGHNAINMLIAQTI
ncbi:reverse transcriptase domain-containing protein [Sphingobium sp. CR2-8]|uniref:reverse transcriptase domain-containing protein n=1 Tax=Sphingobium sp. CR2-8 TaxID=1306534 RepID=UPI002DB95BAA|nr:reverse transcriptase domain-containing protein [Sphingobium sp. CR2-8]MEC3910057.1 reverse transcriptase domain-containing protein [Sphingobium sp. CR2-8]